MHGVCFATAAASTAKGQQIFMDATFQIFSIFLSSDDSVYVVIPEGRSATDTISQLKKCCTIRKETNKTNSRRVKLLRS